jgi:DnaK suppressor protein
MEEKFLEQQKKSLLDRRDKLQAELESVRGDDIKNEADYPDFGDSEDDNSAEVAEFSTNLSLENTLEKALRDVTDALERIEKGTYGVCKYCKQEIDERRLLARPSSSACIKCKEEMKSRP